MSKTTVDELKTLYVKLGGKVADVKDVQTDAEMIDKLEDIVKGLPSVTASDNGKILAVKAGEWKAQTLNTNKIVSGTISNGSISVSNYKDLIPSDSITPIIKDNNNTYWLYFGVYQNGYVYVNVTGYYQTGIANGLSIRAAHFVFNAKTATINEFKLLP